MKTTSKATGKKVKTTAYTLWTAPQPAQEHVEYKLEVTAELKAQYDKAISDTQPALKKKLKSFETPALADAAVRVLLK